ncbi:MAG: 3-deoxy-7-phosphoheptulonate synthase, partial [Nitrospirae bacterium]
FVVLKPDAKEGDIEKIINRLKSMGFSVNISKGIERTVIGVIGDTSKVTEEEEKSIEVMDGVERLIRVTKPYKLASREFKSEDTEIDVSGNVIGGKKIQVIAGPCAVENRENLFAIAERVKAAGASFVRGGAFKPRTSPYTFQGLGVDGLKLLSEVKKEYGLPVVTELMDPRDIDALLEYADIIQIGARNMQNFRLLTEVGSYDKPVLLKRGLCATLKELLMAAEYILSRGNTKVILCERGIRTFETATRNTLDLSAVPMLKKLSHLPVIVDPSHGVGVYDCVAPMAKAAVACGADGLLIEVHIEPEKALSDGAQSLRPDAFSLLMEELKAVASAVGRSI